LSGGIHHPPLAHGPATKLGLRHAHLLPGPSKWIHFFKGVAKQHSHVGQCCIGQVLRERVAAGRKLVEAIQAALPAAPLPAEAPVGQRARRARSEYGSHRRSTTPEHQAGVLHRPQCLRSRFRFCALDGLCLERWRWAKGGLKCSA